MAEILGTEHPSETEVIIRLSAGLPAEQCNAFESAAAAKDNGLARALFLIMGVVRVAIATDQIVITRDPAVIWPLIIPPAFNIIRSRLKKLHLEVA